MTDWRPIATAPKDGTEILVWDADIKDTEKAFWSDHFVLMGVDFGGAWMVGGTMLRGDTRMKLDDPVFWQHKPEPPV